MNSFDKEMEEKINSKLQEIDNNAKQAAKDEAKKEVAKVKDEMSEINDYEPFKVTEEDEKMLDMIEGKLGEVKKDNNFKPTSTVKLDDALENDKFFDDFFED